MQDEQNLYVYVDFKSPFYNHAVENSGFIVYISEDEDNKKRRGLGFPSGAFNLMREDPASFRDMTRDSDWLNNTQNYRRLESLQEENFNQVMIVERYEDTMMHNTVLSHSHKSKQKAWNWLLHATGDIMDWSLKYRLIYQLHLNFYLGKVTGSDLPLNLLNLISETRKI
jgi:hypothetical protein